MKGLLYMKSKEQFIEILESFEEDQIDTPFKQSAHLCSETILSIDALPACASTRDTPSGPTLPATNAPFSPLAARAALPAS